MSKVKKRRKVSDNHKNVHKKERTTHHHHSPSSSISTTTHANLITTIPRTIANKLQQLAIRLLLYLKNLFLTLVAMMMTSKSGVGGGEQSSSKKEARLRNKQSKLAAEYRLVTGKEEEDVEEDRSSGGKRRKLDDGGGGGGRKLLNEEEFKAMKLELAERKRALVNLPRFKMTQSSGLQASVFFTEYANRTPLLFSDIQHLITYVYGGNDLVPPPSRWCHLQKPGRMLQLVVLVVDGVGLNEFVDNEESFGRMMGIFGGDVEENRGIFEVLDPSWYGDSAFGEVERWGILGSSGCGGSSKQIEEMVVGTSGREDEKEGEKVEAAQDSLAQFQNFDPILNQLRSVFPIEKKENNNGKESSLPSSDKFPRTALLLNLPQLIHENYPLPIPANTLTRNTKTGYTLTSESYSPVTSNSKMYSIDCEMCEAIGDPNALIRIGVVDEELGTVYESLVRPEGKIVDYRTRWSGVSGGMMEGVQTTLGDVQGKLIEIVAGSPGCILVGQSLNCDLKAIKLLHPYIIDTSTIFNLTGIAGRKSSLKDLSLNILDEVIQTKDSNKGSSGPHQGHCPVEDAGAAMKLVKAKLANGYSFGNNLKPGNGGGDADTSSSTLVCFEDPLVKNKLGSCGNNKLDKDVLIVTQEDETFPFFSTLNNNTPYQQDTPSTAPPPMDTTTPSSRKIKSKSTTTNGNAIKLMHTHFLESFLTVGLYRLNEETEDFGKTLGKLDKRVEKLFNRMCCNSMLVVVGSRGKVEEGSGGRKNNGICFVRVKVDDVVKNGRVRRE